MRFGNWRGVTLAAGLVPALLLVIGLSSRPARAQGYFHTIPGEVQAIDLNTGGPYYAPPIPNGCYSKDPSAAIGKIAGPIHGVLGRLHGGGGGIGDGLCGQCGGRGCNACGGTGHLGLGSGCDTCGTGLFGKHHGLGSGCSLCGGKGCGVCLGHATTAVAASGQGIPTPQAAPIVASPQCGDPGCGLLGKHHHKGCGLCGGKGCRSCAVSDPCSRCGGRGCGLCGGLGRGGDPCSACGGRGCGLCGGTGGLAATAHGVVGHLLGHDKIQWFVGAGGPVPLTPGYVPYINVTRSPRDFFAFPPMTP
jgi:hypothetical protein